MSRGVSSQPEKGTSTGRNGSIWLRLDVWAKLDRMATKRGVKRNRVISQILDEAEED